jgi:uncharacterized protein YkwD
MKSAKNYAFRTIVLATATSLAAFLTACGGGGGSSGSEPTAPTASGTAPTIAVPVVLAPIVLAPVVSAAPLVDAGTLSSVITPGVYAADSVAGYMFESLNAIRLAGGFGTLTQNILLDKAAQAQADYATANYILPTGGWDVQALFAVSANGFLIRNLPQHAA